MSVAEQAAPGVSTARGVGAPAIDRPAVSFALVAIGLLAGILALEVSARMAALLAVGAGLGFVLLHAAFGFTAGWRNLIVRRDGRGFRAQLGLVGLTMLLFVPLLNGWGPEGLAGAVAPVGTSLVVGSFMFGLGMQLGNGCGSGTLFALGGGSVRMLIVLVAFIIGSLIGSLHLPWWLDRPGFDPVDLGASLGVPAALVLQAAGLGLLAWWSVSREPRADRPNRTDPQAAQHRLLRGPWPYLWAIVALAALNLATLLLAGHPWTITYGFALWGAKAAGALGFDVSGFEFWRWAKGETSLNNSLLADVTSVMNIGLILGAMLAAALAGSFARAAIPGLRSSIGAVLGGLLMGYGARLGFGCNIGAFLGGIASGSLHGWIWFASAFAGTFAGVRLRPLFGLAR